MELNYEKAAMVLVESDFFGDEEVATRWGITTRTIRNYRNRLAIDPQLSALFQVKRQLFAASWIDDASKTLKISLGELSRRVRIATNEEDAKVIHAIAGAAKIVGELKIAHDALMDAPIDIAVGAIEAG